MNRLAIFFGALLMWTPFVWTAIPVVGSQIERALFPIIEDVGFDMQERGKDMAALRWQFRRLRPAGFVSFDATIITADGDVIDAAPLECTGEPRYFRTSRTSEADPNRIQQRIICIDIGRARIPDHEAFTVHMTIRYLPPHGLWTVPHRLEPQHFAAR